MSNHCLIKGMNILFDIWILRAQVQSFGDDIRGISAVYSGFTFSIKEIADEQRILLTATAALTDSFDSKSVY